MLPPPPAEQSSRSFAQASRRNALKLGALGLAGLATPLAAQTGGGSFTHAVASGEPGPDRVLLWTRFVASAETKLVWELSETQDFAKLAASGEALASPDRDWCAKAMATELMPGRWYYYRFVAPSGEVSPVGRTRTLPVGKVPRFRLAVFSCSNYGFGWFNAYAHAAEAGDFDLAVHLGDYFYEYQRGEYPSVKQALTERVLPVDEAVTLAGYRERFATYRTDPDLQRLHQLYPMISVWDDHEIANDTWAGGAENHDPATEGDWEARKTAAARAYREWLPMSDADWAEYPIGKLATLYRLETRKAARTKPFDLQETVKDLAPDKVAGALAAFRDGAWQDARHTLLGATQEAWLGDGFKRSRGDGATWQVLLQQIVMTNLLLPDVVLETAGPKTPDWLRQRLTTSVAAAHEGLPWSMDAWDGYPAARQRLQRASLAAGANLIVLSGDSHNAWAGNLTLGKERVGVELAGHAVTSPGAEGTLPWLKPQDLAAALTARNPQLAWCDTSQRGYLALELTPQSASGEWRFLQSVRQKGNVLASSKRMTVLAGQHRFTTS